MAAGMVGITTTTTAATGALTRFKVAMISTGVGAVALAAVALGAWFLAGKMGSDEANESLEKYNRTFGFTQELYDNMLSAYEGVDMTRILDDLGIATRDIQDTLSDIANTEDAALIASYETKLKLAQEERDVLLQIKAIKGAEMLLTDTNQAQGIFDQVKGAQAINDELKEAKDNYGFFDKGVQAFTYLTSMGDEDLAKSQTVLDIEAIEQNAEDAFAAIPKEFQGAVQEMAQEADSMEDFLSKLAEFADSTGGDFGRNFGTGIQENIIGPIEAAKEAAFEFNNAREEMFFGLSKGNLTGDMVKQVVNKGVETLINTTEVIMTNNFTGMTTTQAANEITKEVMKQLGSLGLNVQQA